MKHSGRCYCGQIQYETQGDAVLTGQCYCRECQHIAGGAPQLFVVLPKDGIRYITGGPSTFVRKDLDDPVTRQFCCNCGTHLITQRSDLDGMILKIGTLDNPNAFGGPKIAM
jgi:hypothetical protein